MTNAGLAALLEELADSAHGHSFEYPADCVASCAPDGLEPGARGHSPGCLVHRALEAAKGLRARERAELACALLFNDGVTPGEAVFREGDDLWEWLREANRWTAPWGAEPSDGVKAAFGELKDGLMRVMGRQGPHVINIEEVGGDAEAG